VSLLLLLLLLLGLLQEGQEVAARVLREVPHHEQVDLHLL
jgi:hypothetical protein